MQTVNRFPSLLSINLIWLSSDNTRGMPDPNQRYGIVLAQKFVMRGFRAKELLSITSSMLCPPMMQPGLIISTRSSNTRRRIAAVFSKSACTKAFCSNSSNTVSGISNFPTELKDCPLCVRWRTSENRSLRYGYIEYTFYVTLGQLKLLVVGNAIYNRMIYSIVRHCGNCCNLIAPIFRGCATMVNLLIVCIVINDDIPIMKYTTSPFE